MPGEHRIFLAHAREDKKEIRRLYRALEERGYRPWLDEIDLIPGQIWKEEIPRAIQSATVFLACLSQKSTSKVGYVQSEFRRALAGFAERPPGSIYFVPVRLDECELPDLQIPDFGRSLRDIHWVDLWTEGGLDRLLVAIDHAIDRREDLHRPEVPQKRSEAPTQPVAEPLATDDVVLELTELTKPTPTGKPPPQNAESPTRETGKAPLSRPGRRSEPTTHLSPGRALGFASFVAVLGFGIYIGAKDRVRTSASKSEVVAPNRAEIEPRPGPWVVADCFGRQMIGLYTERHYGELDRPWRDQVNDPKINSLASSGLRDMRAEVVEIDAATLEAALDKTRAQDLPVLAFLDVEARSSEIPMQYGQTTMVTIETAIRLQFLNAANGETLGESSDFGKSTGLDIEQALPDMLQAAAIASMADKAGRDACKQGWAAETVVAETTAAAPAVAANQRLVTKIQYALNDLGYDVGRPDGIAGSVTQDAIRRAEDYFRLPLTGKATQGLLAKLHEQLWTDTQLLLKDLGRIKSGASGTANLETELSIKAIEREQGFPVDGKPDGRLISFLEAQVIASGVEAEVDNDPTLRFEIENLLVELQYLQRPPSGEESFDGSEAMRRAELDFGLEPDGLPDVSLFRKLQSAQRGS
ncbi:MAG: TIR domain-containing protein [Rhizobiales bacterium]|nr:TIR domain-containing protein [Hyphomicrobiales bacterium]